MTRIKRTLAIGAVLATAVLVAVVWFLYDETLPARLVSWLPGQADQFTVPPDVAAQFQGELVNQREEPQEIGTRLRVLFVGDTSFGESYQDQSFFDARGYDFFLEELRPLLYQSDLVVANLETPLTNLTKSPLARKKQYVHRGNVYKAPAALHNHNIRSVSLANNHALDYGIAGLLQTLKTLQKNDIAWFGAGLNESQASKPLRWSFTLEGYPFKLVVVSGFVYSLRYDLLFHFYAKGQAGGVKMWTRKNAADQLRTIRRANSNPCIVAFPHWGRNYQFKNKAQTKLAHALIDAGADLVIGHGAHMLQEIEHYRGRWIIYSLGNFIFNSPGLYREKDVDPFSLAASLDVTHQEGSVVLALRLYPIFSDNRISHYQPRLVTMEELSRVKDILIRRSPNAAHLQKHLSEGEDEVGLFLALQV